MKTNFLVTPDQDALNDWQPLNNNSVFEDMYKRYGTWLSKQNCLQGLTQDDKEDIISDTWLKVFQNQSKFTYQGESKLRGWLGTILRNTTIDHNRRQQKLREHLPSISLDKLLNSDNNTALIEVLSDQSGPDLQTDALKETVFQFAQQCQAKKQLTNKQLELLKCDLWGLKYPPTWSHNWMYTNRSRTKARLIEYAKQQQ